MTSSICTTSLMVALALIVTSPGTISGLDLTLQEDSVGVEVVVAVISRLRYRCIFTEDNLFLRRMAHVTSRDGTASATYVPGVDSGGIWQVNETQFLATVNCSTSPLLSPACQTILSDLSIDWSGSVTWSDLRKPLYSGLAASLYTMLHLNGSVMSGNVTQQAHFYSSVYGGNETEFEELAANVTDLECREQLDLVFVLDSSGSVSTSDFDLMRSFAAQVVQVMSVGVDSVHVASIVYGSLVQTVFRLDQYFSATDVSQALLSTPKLGGGTITHEAIDAAEVTLFNATYGGRSDAKKVMVLVTDGQSWDPIRTANFAFTLKERGTTSFVIGVGNYNLTELTAMASSPPCSHVFTLTDFSDMLTILTQIQASACGASLVLPPGSHVTGEIPDSSVEMVTQALNPGPGRTIEVDAACGTVHVYLSYTEPAPNPALHEYAYTASHGNPVVMTTNASLAQGDPVYVTLVGTRMSAAQAAGVGCVQHEWAITVEEPASLVRLVNGASDSEGRVELFANGVWGSVCDDNFHTEDAIVVCRMVGLESLVPLVHPGAHYGPARGRIGLDEVDCAGGESSLLLCGHSGVGVNDCSHSEDVGVDCLPSNASALTLVRLVNGSRSSEGRVEVYNGGQWGTVCGDNFDVDDAAVVCSMLNYTSRTPEVKDDGDFSEGQGSIWLDEVDCSGSEFTIFVCAHSGLGQHDCLHDQDIGVDCDPERSAVTPESTTIVLGLVIGMTSVALVVVTSLLCFKFAAGGRGRVKVFKFNSRAHDETELDHRPNPLESPEADSDPPPIPGLMSEALAMRRPADTRLPPLPEPHVAQFPPLRY